MSHDRLGFGPGLVDLIFQSDREGLRPEQVLRRLGLYGYSEADLEVVVEDFNAQVAKIRRFFRDSGHVFKAGGEIEGSGVAEAIRSEQGQIPALAPTAA